MKNRYCKPETVTILLVTVNMNIAEKGVVKEYS